MANAPDHPYTAVAWRGLALSGAAERADAGGGQRLDPGHPDLCRPLGRGEPVDGCETRSGAEPPRAGGPIQEAEPVLREALAQAEALGDREQELAATGLLVELFSATGRPDSAAVYRDRGVGLQEGAGAPDSTAADGPEPVSESG